PRNIGPNPIRRLMGRRSPSRVIGKLVRSPIMIATLNQMVRYAPTSAATRNRFQTPSVECWAVNVTRDVCIAKIPIPSDMMKIAIPRCNSSGSAETVKVHLHAQQFVWITARESPALTEPAVPPSTEQGNDRRRDQPAFRRLTLDHLDSRYLEFGLSVLI